MYSDSLGAAAGFAPERSSLTGGVPSVSNAGVVGGVIHLAAVLWVAHVRLRRAMGHSVQRHKSENQKEKPTQLSTLNHTPRAPTTQILIFLFDFTMPRDG